MDVKKGMLQEHTLILHVNLSQQLKFRNDLPHMLPQVYVTLNQDVQ